jgi:casein kinase 1
MVEIIEKLHSDTQYIHRNIKPRSFRVDDGKLFITRFNHSTEWFKEERHIHEGADWPDQDTLEFASHWTHEGVTQSRRDDLEMIAYSVLQLLGDDPKAELWPTVIIKQTSSIQEMN